MNRTANENMRQANQPNKSNYSKQSKNNCQQSSTPCASIQLVGPSDNTNLQTKNSRQQQATNINVNQTQQIQKQYNQQKKQTISFQEQQIAKKTFNQPLLDQSENQPQSPSYKFQNDRPIKPANQYQKPTLHDDEEEINNEGEINKQIYNNIKGYQEQNQTKNNVGITKKLNENSISNQMKSQNTAYNADDRPIKSTQNKNNQFQNEENNYNPNNYQEQKAKFQDKQIKPQSKQLQQQQPKQQANLSLNPDENVELFECPEGCGRKFNEIALEKHVKLCKKVFQSKRPKYNSEAARAVNDDEIRIQKNTSTVQQKSKQQDHKKGIAQGDGKTSQQQTSNQQKAAAKKAKWKQQSEAFRAILKVSKQGDQADPAELANINFQTDDLTPCPHCGRKFNETAATRHIPICEKKAKENNIKNGGKAKLSATANLKSTLPGKKFK